MSLQFQFLKYFFVKEKYRHYIQIKTCIETSNYDKPAITQNDIQNIK